MIQDSRPVVEQHGREPQDGARGDDGEPASGDGAAEAAFAAERVDGDEGDVLGHHHHVEDAGPDPGKVRGQRSRKRSKVLNHLWGGLGRKKS